MLCILPPPRKLTRAAFVGCLLGLAVAAFSVPGHAVVYTTDTTVSTANTVTGTDSVEVTNGATVTFSASQDYKGTTTVTDGTLILNFVERIDNSDYGTIPKSSGYTIEKNGILELQKQNALNPTSWGNQTLTINGGELKMSTGNYANVGAITLNGGTISGEGDPGYGAFLFRDNITVTADSEISANYTIRGIWGTGNLKARVWDVAEGATLTVSGRGRFQETGGADPGYSTLTKTGAGTILFTNAALSSNSKSTININAGTIKFTDASAFGSSTANALQINVNAGTLEFEGSGNIYNNITVASGGNFNLSPTSDTYLRGALLGAGNVTGTMTNKHLYLEGNNSDFTGTFTQGGHALFFNAANTSFAKGSLVNNGTVSFLAPEAGIKYSFGSLSGSGGMYPSSKAAYNVTVVVGSLNKNETYSGTIANYNDETLAIEKVGTGTWTLSATNSNFSGGLTVHNGAVEFTHPKAIGTGTVTLTKTSDTESGKVVYKGGGGTISNDFVLNAGTSLAFQQNSTENDTLYIAGAISGSGAVSTNAGDKFIRLTGDNSGFSGEWTHSGSYLIFTNATSSSKDAAYNLKNTGVVFLPSVNNSIYEFGSLSGSCWDMRLSSGTIGANRNITLRIGNLNQDDDLTARIRDGDDSSFKLGIEKVGTGTLTLNRNGDNNNTYSGGTTVKNGTVKFTHVNAIGTGTIKTEKTETETGNLAYDGGSGTLTNNISLAEGTAFTVTTTNNNTRLILTGNVSGSGNIDLTTGMLRYSGTDSNSTFTPSVNVGSGTMLEFNKFDLHYAGNLTGTGTANFLQQTRLEGDNGDFEGTLDINNTVFLTGKNSSSGKAAYDVNQLLATVASVAGETFELGGLSGTGRIRPSVTSTQTSMYLKVGGNNEDSVYDGYILNYSSDQYQMGLIKTGTGMLTLTKDMTQNLPETGTSAYSLGTTVEDGILKIAKGAAIGTGGNNLVLVEEISTSGGDTPGIILEGTIDGRLQIDGQLILDFTDDSYQDIGIIDGELLFGANASLDIWTDDTDELNRDMTYTLQADNTEAALGMMRELYDAGVLAGSFADIWSIGLVDGNLVFAVDPAKVPEPATWLLLLGSLVGMTVLRHRNRKSTLPPF